MPHLREEVVLDDAVDPIAVEVADMGHAYFPEVHLVISHLSKLWPHGPENRLKIGVDGDRFAGGSAGAHDMRVFLFVGAWNDVVREVVAQVLF